MKTNTINKEEIEKFSRIAEEWWNPTGKFKPLHKFNPIRISYFKENIINTFKLKNKDKPLKNLKILDIESIYMAFCIVVYDKFLIYDDSHKKNFMAKLKEYLGIEFDKYKQNYKSKVNKTAFMNSLLINKIITTPVKLANKSYSSKALLGTIKWKISNTQEINKINK